MVVAEYRFEDRIQIREFQGVDLDLTGGEHQGTFGFIACVINQF